MKVIAIRNMRTRIDSFESEESIKDFREEVKAAAAAGESLKLFSLMGNSYGSNFFKELVPYLEKIPSIEAVNFNDIFTQRVDDILTSLKIISPALMGKQIKALDISNNAICPTGCEAMFEFLKSCDQLQYFWANNSALAQNGVIWVAKAFEETKPPLKVLSMTRNRIEVKAIEVAKALVVMPTLQELVLFQNGIMEEGMTPLLAACAKLPNLKKLDIHDNWIIKGSVQGLLDLLSANKSIVDLDISDCNFEGGSNEPLVELLEKDDRAWERFGHEYNELEDGELAGRFSKALTKSKTLQYLSVKGNEWETPVVEATQLAVKDWEKQPELIFESDEEDFDDEDEQPGEGEDALVVEFDEMLAKFKDLSLD